MVIRTGVLEGVREHSEGSAVKLGWSEDGPDGRLVIRAWNEGGHNCTEVDMLDLLGNLGIDPAPLRFPAAAPIAALARVVLALRCDATVCLGSLDDVDAQGRASLTRLKLMPNRIDGEPVLAIQVVSGRNGRFFTSLWDECDWNLDDLMDEAAQMDEAEMAALPPLPEGDGNDPLVRGLLEMTRGKHELEFGRWRLRLKKDADGTHIRKVENGSIVPLDRDDDAFGNFAFRDLPPKVDETPGGPRR